MAAAPAGLNRFYLILVVVGLAGGAGLAYLALRRPTISIPANVSIEVSDTSGFRGYYLGSDSAPLTITEYADYECPACQQFTAVQMPTIVERLIATGRVRWRYRDFPLEQHRHARPAAHAAACAEEQGKYWEMNQRIYAWDPQWPFKSDATEIFRDYAKAVGLDVAKYDACMQSARYAGRLQASLIEGQRAGVSSTPTFLINGRLYPGSIHYDMLKALLDSIQGKPNR